MLQSSDRVKYPRGAYCVEARPQVDAKATHRFGLKSQCPTDWNEARTVDIRAQAYLRHIQGNPQADVHSIERRQVFWGKAIGYGKGAIHYAETGELVDGSAWKTLRAFYQASQLWEWATSDAT